MKTEQVKKVVASVLTVLAGGLFVFSAITKLMPVEAFEISLVDVGVASFKSAPIFARLLIGLEFVIGFLLLLHFKLRKFTIPLAALLLVIFTVYIGYLLKAYGNTGSCGCFGTVIEVTPLEGVIKNIVLLAMLLVSYLWAYSIDFKNKTFLAAVGAAVLVALPFLVNPMDYPFSSVPFAKFERFPIDTVSMYESTPTSANPAVDVTHGKHIVVMLSAGCSHCRLVAKKMMVFKKQSPELPLIFVLYNNVKLLPEFWADTKSESLPHVLIKEKPSFLTLTDNNFPRIYWVDNGVVVYKNNLYDLDKAAMENWLASTDTITKKEATR